MNNNQNWIDKWNHNFQNKEYVYGKLPNVFLKEVQPHFENNYRKVDTVTQSSPVGAVKWVY